VRLVVPALAALTLLACAHSGGVHGLTELEQAKLSLDQGKAQDALPGLERAHARAPADLEVARMLVEAYVKTGRGPELRQRLPDDRTTPPAVRSYMLGLAEFADPATAGAKAIADFRQAVALSPGEAELHYRLGLALLESEQYDQALPALSRAAELAPRNTGYPLPLAKALARTGHREEAVKALRQVVQGDPSPEDVKLARALMQGIADPFAGFPDAARARLERGMAWLRNADVPQEAIIQFEDILRDYPDLAVVHALLGLSYERLDDAGRAVDELKRAIELSPRIGKNWLYLGELYLSHQRSVPAQEAFEKALALDPLLDAAYSHLGDLAIERRDLSTAQEMFGALTALQPDALPPKGKLALALELGGDYAGASRVLHQVVKQDPENLEFLLRLGLVEVERAQHAASATEKAAARAEAERCLDQVLKRQPDNAIASRALQDVKR
jgi:tetratricopeptide (TPR) repeat protein